MTGADLQTSLGLLQLFGDATRVRLMALLEARELTVAELTAITGLSQSRVSTHLGKLREAGLLDDRRQGASTYYCVRNGEMPGEARQLWTLLRTQIHDAVLDGDRARCEAVVQARDSSPSWPDAVAGEMERHYSPGRTWEALARGFLGLVRLGDVLDVGCGDGTIASLLAPRAVRYTGLDRSEHLVEAARHRVGARPGVRFRQGDMHALPFEDARFDQVLMFNVLTYSEQPARALREASRVLAPGGDLVLGTLAAHDHTGVTEVYGHVHGGFDPDGLARMLRDAGLTVDQCEITSRERRKPHFEVVTAFATKPGAPDTRKSQ